MFESLRSALFGNRSQPGDPTTNTEPESPKPDGGVVEEPIPRSALETQYDDTIDEEMIAAQRAQLSAVVRGEPQNGAITELAGEQAAAGVSPTT